MDNDTGSPSRQRLAWARTSPEALQAMLQLDKVGSGRLDHPLRELIRLRASGLNGCAYCLDLDAKAAAEQGVSPQRLVAVAAWEEAAHLFTEREQAALALTDAVTRLGEHGVTDDVWDRATAQFDEKELVDVLMAIVAINAWNRLGITARMHVKPQV